MPLTLPEPIANYFAADRGDPDAIARCFTSDAEVTDEGRIHKGVAAIKRWKAEASTKYTYTIEPSSIEQRDGVSVVTGHVAGNFPGSPVDLRFLIHFGTRKDLVAQDRAMTGT